MKKIILFQLLYILILSYPALIPAQESSSLKLTILNAIDIAKENFPAIRASKARTAAATAEIGLAQSSYLPHLDLLWQENRATRNNVFGMLLPQSVIPSISGPVLGLNSGETVWGSAGGALLSWEFFDFGRRGAQVEAARALQSTAGAQETLTLLDASGNAAVEFLMALAADEGLKAARANVERMNVFLNSVTALFTNQLRSGADKAYATAELASAQIQLIRAEQQAGINHFNLAKALGEAGKSYMIEPGILLDRLPVMDDSRASPVVHPLALMQASVVESERARKKILGALYYPRFNFQFAYFARGTSALPGGGLDLGKGITPDVSNWATGITVMLPLFDFAGIRKNRNVAQSRIENEQAQYDGVLQQLETGISNAQETANAALRIAEKTPVQLEAARETQKLTRARYDAGLATVVEVAEAERLLTQAEIDNSVARLDVWRAFINLAMAKGDLRSVIEQIKTDLREGKP